VAETLLVRVLAAVHQRAASRAPRPAGAADPAPGRVPEQRGPAPGLPACLTDPGVITAILIAALAVLAIIAGTVAPAPEYVLVIHDGRAGCVPAAATAKFAHVSQVITVSGC
jgi:hypothetical protein